jgi:diamine N-acetyltransferase
MAVSLVEVSADNWQECIRLQVADDQREFVASNLYSLAQSKFEPSCVPLAIYDQEIMVGFAMTCREGGDVCWIYRLMIDKRYQRRGYARAAMDLVIQRLRDDPDCREILISYDPENIAARELYRRLGFESTGQIDEGELVLRLPEEC